MRCVLLALGHPHMHTRKRLLDLLSLLPSDVLLAKVTYTGTDSESVTSIPTESISTSLEHMELSISLKDHVDLFISKLI